MARKPSKPKEITEHCCWSVNIAGLIEVLNWEGVKHVVVSLDDREPPADYSGPRRLRVWSYTYSTPTKADGIQIPRTPTTPTGGQT